MTSTFRTYILIIGFAILVQTMGACARPNAEQPNPIAVSVTIPGTEVRQLN